ncbi:MAG: response regulator [Bacteroidales bacterium]|nr:response regulator [Bacteroidales bacterium]
MSIKPNIIVAEDEEYNFALIRIIFEKEGMNILWAKNGEEAIDIFINNDTIDLVLMDIKMPIMNGLDATRAIKKINSDIPVIALTAYALPEDRDLCMEAGCDEFVTKPINRANLLETAYKWLDQ